MSDKRKTLEKTAINLLNRVTELHDDDLTYERHDELYSDIIIFLEEFLKDPLTPKPSCPICQEQLKATELVTLKKTKANDIDCNVCAHQGNEIKCDWCSPKYPEFEQKIEETT